MEGMLEDREGGIEDGRAICEPGLRCWIDGGQQEVEEIVWHRRYILIVLPVCSHHVHLHSERTTTSLAAEPPRPGNRGQKKEPAPPFPGNPTTDPVTPPKEVENSPLPLPHQGEPPQF
jgi:hypothetical protein